MTPLADSHLRFSSPQQATGDSIRRQTQAREAWLAAHPTVELDKRLVMTDPGRSAFKRTDWDTYALARFVDHIKSGQVKAGSYLLVENLDRLSREDAGEATKLFLSIVNKGIVVVQLSPIVMEFRRPVNVQSLMFAIVELSRGHSESATKSERVGAAWARKQREASERVVTRRLPGWVRYDNGKLVLDVTKAETVRRIYALALDGLGVWAIAKLFNEQKVPVIGRQTFKGRPAAWCSTTVHHILRTRAVLGDYVPYRCRTQGRKPTGEPVPNYFPPVIDADTFQRVQAGLKTHERAGSGRWGKHVNLFAGLLVDARNGGSLTYRHTTRWPSLLVPVDAAQGRGSVWASFPSAPFEDAVLSRLRELTASAYTRRRSRRNRDGRTARPRPSAAALSRNRRTGKSQPSCRSVLDATAGDRPDTRRVGSRSRAWWLLRRSPVSRPSSAGFSPSSGRVSHRAIPAPAPAPAGGEFPSPHAVRSRSERDRAPGQAVPGRPPDHPAGGAVPTPSPPPTRSRSAPNAGGSRGRVSAVTRLQETAGEERSGDHRRGRCRGPDSALRTPVGRHWPRQRFHPLPTARAAFPQPPGRTPLTSQR
jgi:DNA invertase Pin-like site-specific DNA recombinase